MDMSWLVGILERYPELSVYLTVGIGYAIGKVSVRGVSLGPVTGSLLAGIALSQFARIYIPDTGRSLFFLLFLFGIGYSVGPQFVSALRGGGSKIALLGIVVPLAGLGTAYVVARVLGLDPGLSAGLVSGALTESPAIGTATDAIRHLQLATEQQELLINHIVVADAVCYLFGTIGVIWMCSSLGPKLLGLDPRIESEKLERSLGIEREKPNVVKVRRQFEVRAYRVLPGSQAIGKSVAEIEEWLQESRTFIHRIRRDGEVMEAGPDIRIQVGDTISVSGRRELLVTGGPGLTEVDDVELIDLPATTVDVFATNKDLIGRPLGELAAADAAQLRGVYLTKIARLEPNGRHAVPIGASIRLQYGDIVSLVGTEAAVERTAKRIGPIIAPSDATDYVVLGIAIFLGGVVGSLVSIPVGGMHIALSTSVGTLLAGLCVGHLQVSHPTFGRIPPSVIMLMTSFGLAAFVAMIGLKAGPLFFDALQRQGVGLLLGGIVVTMVPQFVGLAVGRYLLRIHPILLLGALSGAQTMTAGLAALQQKSGSPVAVIGYTAAVPFGHILLTVWGTVIVWLMA